MKVENTKDRVKVEAIRKWSIQLVSEGRVEEVKNWDAKSPWHNSKFSNLSNNIEWVVYWADQAWPGEVKLLK
ncbi:hypothetical protein [Vibrio salinus]|uniref:hypothetical protein n=1 Tax=Vibrio salinus TaxID=2899784 RepID=UPI001E600CC5|nr:hypothetical protein [Vibrio salinus]MCE0495176.1 hypothetical protein [Vibrio salinus]